MTEWERKAKTKCPTCDSPQPELHPAMQHEGEVQVCGNEWHRSTLRGRVMLDRLVTAPLPDSGGGEKARE